LRFKDLLSPPPLLHSSRIGKGFNPGNYISGVFFAWHLQDAALSARLFANRFQTMAYNLVSFELMNEYNARGADPVFGIG